MVEFKQLYKELVEEFKKAYVMRFLFERHHKYNIIKVDITIIDILEKYKKLANVVGIQDFRNYMNLVTIRLKDGNVIQIFAPRTLIVDVHHRTADVVKPYEEIIDFVRYHS